MLSAVLVTESLAAEAQRLTLPAPATQTVVGGEGRYLILALESAKSVLVVDLLKPSTDGLIQVPTDQFLIAANRSELIVADRVTTFASRYRLSDGKLVSKDLMFPGKYLHFIGMGPSSDGPLWVESRAHEMGANNVSVLDSKTLRKVEHLIAPDRNRDDPKLIQEKERDRSSVSDDGVTFSGNHVTVQIRGKEPMVMTTLRSRGAPSFSGDWLLDRLPPVPTDQPALSLAMSNRRVIPGRCSTLIGTIESKGDQVTVRAYDLFQYGRLRTLPEPIGTAVLPVLPKVEEKETSGLTKERPRPLELLPRAGFIARLENGNRELALFPIKLRDGWLNANPVTAVSSIGHCHAIPGTPIDYRIPVPAGCVVSRFRLIVGPTKMTITNRGRINWTPPKEPISQEAEAFVELQGRDNSIQTHRVVMTIGKAVELDRLRKPIGVPDPMPLTVYGAMQVSDADKLGSGVDLGTVTRLPSRVKRVTVGGGGQYLVMQFPDLESLGVYDVSAGKLQAMLSHHADTFAASADSIFLAYRDERKIERWSIRGLRKLDEVTFNEYIVPTRIAIGSQDRKRLAIHTAHQRVDAIQIVDAMKLDGSTTKLPGNQKDRADVLDMSADGDLIVARTIEPRRIYAYSMVDGQWKTTTFDDESETAMAAGDGDGIVTDAGYVSLSDQDKVDRSQLGRQLWPAVTGSLALMAPLSREYGGPDHPTDHLLVVDLSTGQPVGFVDGLFDIRENALRQAWLIPQQNAVVQLDPTRTMLIRKLIELP